MPNVTIFQRFTFTRSRDIDKNEKNSVLFSPEAKILIKKQKRIFKNLAMNHRAVTSADASFRNNFQRSTLPKAEILTKTKKIFLSGNVSLCIWPVPNVLIFTSNENGLKNKNIFEIWQHGIVRHLKNAYCRKTKNIFEILANVALTELWPKNEKNYFEIYNVVVRYLTKCILAYSEPSIFTSSRDIHCAQLKIDAYGPVPNLLFSPADEIWPRNKKKIFFENWQHNIMHKWPVPNPSIFTSRRDMAGKYKKIFLKFYNVALCGIQNRVSGFIPSFLFSSENEIWPKTK
ncbi:hypothetical protein PUN28_020444 [Cardiocondyla obscurior]|uniref:Uncharacterized protein n=1 Tax=Cardiocondyla obscurior TaxID=286306 RepID=A0AAW2E4A8_9HYME